MGVIIVFRQFSNYRLQNVVLVCLFVFARRARFDSIQFFTFWQTNLIFNVIFNGICAKKKKRWTAARGFGNIVCYLSSAWKWQNQNWRKHTHTHTHTILVDKLRQTPISNVGHALSTNNQTQRWNQTTINECEIGSGRMLVEQHDKRNKKITN